MRTGARDLPQAQADLESAVEAVQNLARQVAPSDAPAPDFSAAWPGTPPPADLPAFEAAVPPPEGSSGAVVEPEAPFRIPEETKFVLPVVDADIPAEPSTARRSRPLAIAVIGIFLVPVCGAALVTFRQAPWQNPVLPEPVVAEVQAIIELSRAALNSGVTAMTELASTVMEAGVEQAPLATPPSPPPRETAAPQVVAFEMTPAVRPAEQPGDDADAHAGPDDAALPVRALMASLGGEHALEDGGKDASMAEFAMAPASEPPPESTTDLAEAPGQDDATFAVAAGDMPAAPAAAPSDAAPDEISAMQPPPSTATDPVADRAARVVEMLAAERVEVLERERERVEALVQQIAGLRAEVLELRAQSAPRWEVPQLPLALGPALLPLAPPEPPPAEPAREAAQAPAQQPEAPAPPSASPEPDGTPDLQRTLIERATALIGARDFSSARLLLERAARDGSPRATYLLAQTYDPKMLKAWSVLGFRGDPVRAEELYAKARTAAALANGRRNRE